jgi:EAL domain-containing protein (putative c-di-GMP-specific phosphodiesterase class I)
LTSFRHCQKHIPEVQKALALTEVPFSVVLPAHLQHWKFINIPSLSSTDDVAAISPFITFDFTEDDVFDNYEVAQKVVLQLRIQNIRTRLSGAGSRYLESNRELLPFQEVVLNPNLLVQPFTDRTSLPISRIAHQSKRAGAVVFAGSINTRSAFSPLKATGIDLYIDQDFGRHSIPLHEFAKEWPSHKVAAGASVRRAAAEDFYVRGF